MAEGRKPISEGLTDNPIDYGFARADLGKMFLHFAWMGQTPEEYDLSLVEYGRKILAADMPGIRVLKTYTDSQVFDVSPYGKTMAVREYKKLDGEIYGFLSLVNLKRGETTRLTSFTPLVTGL